MHQVWDPRYAKEALEAATAQQKQLQLQQRQGGQAPPVPGHTTTTATSATSAITPLSQGATGHASTAASAVNSWGVDPDVWEEAVKVQGLCAKLLGLGALNGSTTWPDGPLHLHHSPHNEGDQGTLTGPAGYARSSAGGMEGWAPTPKLHTDNTAHSPVQAETAVPTPFSAAATATTAPAAALCAGVDGPGSAASGPQTTTVGVGIPAMFTATPAAAAAGSSTGAVTQRQLSQSSAQALGYHSDSDGLSVARSGPSGIAACSSGASEGGSMRVHVPAGHAGSHASMGSRSSSGAWLGAAGEHGAAGTVYVHATPAVGARAPLPPLAGSGAAEGAGLMAAARTALTTVLRRRSTPPGNGATGVPLHSVAAVTSPGLSPTANGHTPFRLGADSAAGTAAEQLPPGVHLFGLRKVFKRGRPGSAVAGKESGVSGGRVRGPAGAAVGGGGAGGEDTALDTYEIIHASGGEGADGIHVQDPGPETVTPLETSAPHSLGNRANTASPTTGAPQRSPATSFFKSLLAPCLSWVHRKFGRGVLVAVEGSWLSLDQGTCFCLLGPNGAGKTTTIKCITGVGEAPHHTTPHHRVRPCVRCAC